MYNGTPKEVFAHYQELEEDWPCSSAGNIYHARPERKKVYQ